MNRNIKLLFALTFSALLISMCRFYDDAERVSPISGLSCQGYTDYFEQGSTVSKGLECYYVCPTGVAGPIEFQEDPSLSLSRGDLDRQYCGITSAQLTATAPTASLSPTPVASPTVQASATPRISPTSQPPLLTGEVTMCDSATDLISFRIVQPPPDLTDKALTVQISGQESTCTVNPVNPSLLTCTIPQPITFPADVVVSLGGVVVNEFTYDGLRCTTIE